MRKTLRIFISSPGDVQEERLRAHLVVQKLARDYQRFFKIEPYLWEYEPMLASGHFQDAIEPPSQSDIVVLVVYSRLGTPLPERTAARAYRGIDGRVPVTGTEWEFEEALEANRSRGAPDLVAYRKLGDPQTSLADPGKRAEQERQWDNLESFWRRHFEGGGVFLAGSSKFRTLEEFDAKLEADLVRIIEAKVAAGLKDVSAGEEATWLHGSPFQGLAAYDFHDAPVFFGRDAQIRQASTRLQAAAEAGTAFLLILGASGSGKSSLARAGLLPALFAAKAVPGVGLWRRAALRPAEGGEDPVLSLAKALVAGDPADGEGLPELVGTGMGAAALAAHLAAAPDDPSFPFRQALARIADGARTRMGLLPHEEARLVLLVDQAEELFTRDIDPGRRALFVRILAGLARSGVVWIVTTMRNDLWHRAAEIPDLVTLVEAGARLDLPAPGGAEIIEIVRRPAAAAGIVFEKDGESGVALDAVLARAASEEPGALPLLSVMLQSLYARDVVEAGGRALTVASYRELGELKGAIARRADHVMSELRARDPEAGASLPRVLRALVTASGEGTTTSRPAPLDTFPAGGPERRLVEALLAPENRLLVASERDGTAEIRLAHEALLENWPSARERIATDRRDLQTRARLETLQRRWAEAASPSEKKKALLASLNLAEGSDLVRRWGIPRGEGLGAYVAQSEAAERWRRGRVAVAACALMLIFAGIAALASLQWRRAEEQSVLARAAEETERQAREGADRARNEAVRERDRADAEKARALAALRDAKRSQARTLATEAELAADRSEVGRALALALGAAEAEDGALEPGERSAAHPALLRALAPNRQALHVQRPRNEQVAFLPSDFYGRDGLIYAESGLGVMTVDLPTGRVSKLMALPGDLLPNRVIAVPSAGLVVVTGIRTLLFVDAVSGALRWSFTYSDHSFVSDVDVDAETGTVAVAYGTGIGLIDLAAPAEPQLVDVPSATPTVRVGQVRFVPGSRKLLVAYGLAILEYDRDTKTFTRMDPELVADAFGRENSEELQRSGLRPLIEIVPDPAQKRFVLHNGREAIAATGEGRQLSYERGEGELFYGVSRFGRGPVGGRSLLLVRGRKGDTGIDITLSGLFGDPKGMRFEQFRVSAADLGNADIDTCQVSSEMRYVSCSYHDKSTRGFFVWHLMAGTHRASRLFYVGGQQFVSGATFDSSEGARFIASTDGQVLLYPGPKNVTSGLDWNGTWWFGEADGRLVPAASAEGRLQLLSIDGPDTVRTVLPPVEATILSVREKPDRVLLAGRDGLSMRQVSTGRVLWTVPGLPDLRLADMSSDGATVYVLAGGHAYAFDGGSGRILSSHPVGMKADAPVALDPDARQLAFVGHQGPTFLDLGSGASHALGTPPKFVVKIALAPAAGLVALALEDGSVLGVKPGGGVRWTIGSPADKTFKGLEGAGLRPRGYPLHIAVSRGGRLSVVRFDIASVDLHDVATGQLLIRLAGPGLTEAPAGVLFDAAERTTVLWRENAFMPGRPTKITVHALPFGREDAIAAARAALAALAPMLPDGSRPPAAGPAGNPAGRRS